MSLYWIITVGLSLIILAMFIAIVILGSNYGMLHSVDGRLENIQEKLYDMNISLENIDNTIRRRYPRGYS